MQTVISSTAESSHEASVMLGLRASHPKICQSSKCISLN